MENHIHTWEPYAIFDNGDIDKPMVAVYCEDCEITKVIVGDWT